MRGIPATLQISREAIMISANSSLAIILMQLAMFYATGRFSWFTHFHHYIMLGLKFIAYEPHLSPSSIMVSIVEIASIADATYSAIQLVYLVPLLRDSVIDTPYGWDVTVHFFTMISDLYTAFVCARMLTDMLILRNKRN